MVLGSAFGKGSVCLSASHLHQPPETSIDIKKQEENTDCLCDNTLTDRHLLEQSSNSSGNKTLITSCNTIFFTYFLNSVNSSFIIILVFNKIPFFFLMQATFKSTMV